MAELSKLFLNNQFYKKQGMGGRGDMVDGTERQYLFAKGQARD